MHAQITIGLLDRLFAVPGNTTYGRFERKDAAQITDNATWKFLDWLTGNDGDAGEADIDWAEPGETTDVHGRSGDVVAVYGSWIMDTAHGRAPPPASRGPPTAEGPGDPQSRARPDAFVGACSLAELRRFKKKSC